MSDATGGPAMRVGGPHQHAVRFVRVGVTEAPVLGLAGPVLPQAANKHRQVGRMPGRDLHGGG